MASITVVGSNFTGATMCFFGAIGVTIAMNRDGTSFTCIPPGQTGTVNIGITGSGGTVSRASGYTYMGSPTITSLGVTSGSTAGGTLVRIYGTNFYDRIGITFPGYYCGVSFGTIGVTADIYGITHCYVVTPVSSVAGAVSLKLKTPTGVAIGLTFTYINYCSRSDSFLGFIQPICTAGVSSSCLNNVGPPGRIGCNCTACCDAMCDFNSQCCEGDWEANTCGTAVIEAIADKSGAIYEACKHLVDGSCCVRFNVAGNSFGVCLDPQGSSAECTNLVNYLYAGNSLTPNSPWNNPYTYNFVQGGTCGSCNPYCNGSCLTGTTCGNQCGPCCLRYGYCGSGCDCDVGSNCDPGYTWDPITCSCVGDIGGV
jgi:hypothetical protein